VEAPLYETKGISHQFRLPNGKPLHVLNNINLTIQPHEIVAILGPSGCGKSTLLRILAGLLIPTKGKIFYQGTPMVGLNPDVAVVFQSFALYPWMTVSENVECVLKAASLTQKQIKKKVKEAIEVVGMIGFEEAYPRELSGGMKQMLGMARALSVDPKLLFMDEPFSHVDALTAASLRAGLIDIWLAQDRNPSSIVLVSHDIKEVVYMADRIIVMGARPGHIQTILENRLPRPRDFNSPDFLRLVDQLYETITGAEMPDAPTTGTLEAFGEAEPLPEVSPGEIVGLLEYLDARGGKEDLFRIASDTSREFGKLIPVVKAAEMLNFVKTPRRLVILDTEGYRFIKASVDERKGVWKEQLIKLQLFQEIQEMIHIHPDHIIDRDLVLETIVFRMPYENYEKVFDIFIQWARFGDLFAYDENTQKLKP